MNETTNIEFLKNFSKKSYFGKSENYKNDENSLLLNTFHNNNNNLLLKIINNEVFSRFIQEFFKYFIIRIYCLFI